MSAAERHLNEVLDAFGFGVIAADIVRYGAGHINDTFLVSAGNNSRFILQRINTDVFPRPDQLMENIAGVTAHLQKEILRRGGDPRRETLRLLQTKDERLFHTDPGGGVWRAFPFIADSVCYERVESAEQFAACGRAFGRFQVMLRNYPVSTLHKTIPRFHDTPHRLRQLKEAIAGDICGRAAGCAEEIRFALDREGDCPVLMNAMQAGLLPVRITHNDTKLSNVLFDRNTGREMCVVDLDTVMPGLLSWDFGDAIRSGAHKSPEDDAAAVSFDLELYRAFANTFLHETRDMMTPAETGSLPWGARIMTLECGIRFLTDYLKGDTYFRIHREGQNLDRCRAQFRLLADMERHWEEMQAIV